MPKDTSPEMEQFDNAFGTYWSLTREGNTIGFTGLDSNTRPIILDQQAVKSFILANFLPKSVVRGKIAKLTGMSVELPPDERDLTQIILSDLSKELGL